MRISFRKIFLFVVVAAIPACAKEKEDEKKGEPLPGPSGECVGNESEPRSTDGKMAWSISGDYDGQLEYLCYKVPTLRDGDAGGGSVIREDLGVSFFDNGAGYAYSDTVQIVVTFSQGFYEGLNSFRFCPLTADATTGRASALVKIRTPKLTNPDAVSSTYDVWMHTRCDDETEHLVTIDSHDTAAKKVTGHFQNVPFRTDDSTKRAVVSASFTFNYN